MFEKHDRVELNCTGDEIRLLIKISNEIILEKVYVINYPHIPLI